MQDNQDELTQGEKLRRTMIAKYGSEAEWKTHMKVLAIRGGLKSRGGGFGDRKLAARAGRISRRKPRIVSE